MKKAQVTLFIILGIIILLALAFGIYLTTQVIIKPKPMADDSPIKSYVEDCIQQTGLAALKKIGDNGGYVSFENPYRELNLKTEPAEGDGLSISETGIYAIPYWWYLKTPNNCNNCYLTSDNMPLIPEIEEQINSYVSANINHCLQGFKTFPDYSVKTEELEAETFITKESIRITAEYPIEAVKGNVKTKIKDFETEIRINFKDIYSFAEEIIEQEKTKSVIEDRIMHILSAHMAASYDKLPPISEITHDYYMITWTKPLIEMQIKQILNSYIPLIRFDASKIKTGSKIAQGFYNAMKIDLAKRYDLDASVSYNDWPIYFNIRPDSLTGNSHKQNFPYDIFPPFQTNTYEFFYDLSVPLLIQIHDENAFSGKGYTFTFALEANIRDNKNPNEWNIGEGTLGLWDSEKAITEKTTTQRTQGNCEEVSGKYQCSINSKRYDTIMQCGEVCYRSRTVTSSAKPLKTEFCSAEQRLSGKIKVNALENSGISYSCGNYQTCSIGTTDSNGILEFQLPICYGGILSVHKSGYYTEKIPLTTEQDKAETLEFDLKKEKEFEIRFNKYRMWMNNTQASCCDDLEKPGLAQKALLSIERVGETPVSASLSQSVVLEDSAKIKLVPGNYKVDIKYMDEVGIVIPAECKTVCMDEECEEVKKLPEKNMVIKPALLGGAILDSETGYWQVTQEDIDSGLTNINFYVLEVPTPTCLDTEGCAHTQCAGLDELGKTKEYSLEFRRFLEPKFV